MIKLLLTLTKIFFVSYLLLGMSVISLANITEEDTSVFDEIYFNQIEHFKEKNNKRNYAIDKFNYEGYGIQREIKTSPYNFDLYIVDKKEAVEKRYYLNNQGYEHLISGDYETAIFYYSKFLKEYGRDLDVLAGIASAYHRLGDVYSAKKYYTDVLFEVPNHQVALNNYIVLIGEESPEEGINELEKIANVGDNNIILAQIGYFYALKQDYIKAKKNFEKAYRIDSDNIKLSYNLALSYDRLGEYNNAYFLYKQILFNIKYRSFHNLLPIALIEERYQILDRLKKTDDNSES